jgi:DNA-binding MarR family transcriptional regulator
MIKKALETATADFVQAIGLLVRRVRAAGDAQDVSWSQMSVMKRLGAAGPVTIADLARAESVKPQSMGTTVAALEELELVERTPHPTDGRQMNIRLTAKGAAELKRTGDAKRAWIQQAISQLDEREQQTLFAAGEIIKRLVERDGQ